VISDQGAAQLLTATITSLWVGALVTVGVALLMRFLPIGPSARSRLWTLSLAITILAPMLRLPSTGSRPDEGLVPQLRMPGPQFPGHPFQSSDAGTLSSPKGEEERPTAASPRPAESVAALPLDATLGISLLLLWLAGSLLGVGWLAYQIRRVTDLKRAGAAPDESLQGIWDEVYRNRGRRQVRFLASRRVRLPAA
jgi:hypothetical protein